MKNKEQILKQQFAHLVNELAFEVKCEMLDKQQEAKALKKHIMERPNLLPYSKLVMLWLIENDVEEFNSTGLYRKLNIPKPHFLRYVKPELVKAGFIKETGRSSCLFMNPLKVLF